MNVLVTGASGFFGSEIVTRLRSAGHHVIGASRPREKCHHDTLALDVTSVDSCRRVFDVAGPVDAVVHAAALAHVKLDNLAARRCHIVNAIGTQNIIDAAASADVYRFTLISSVMVYGDFDLPRVVVESDDCRAHGPYGQAKLRAEQICRERSGVIGVHILRMATMYSDDWLSNVRKRVRPFEGGPPVYFTLDPHARRYSLCSRRNGAEAVLWAIEQRMPADVYNVADQYEYCQQEILEAVERVDGAGWHVPVPIAVPRVLWHAMRVGVPFPQLRRNARSQYWKFCERNVYSAEKLRRCGLNTPPDLLSSDRSV